MFYKLKIEILKKYGTQSAFARECGRNDNWISRIVTGRQYPTKKEMALIAEKLGLKNLKEYFTTSKRTVFLDGRKKEIET